MEQAVAVRQLSPLLLCQAPREHPSPHPIVLHQMPYATSDCHDKMRAVTARRRVTYETLLKLTAHDERLLFRVMGMNGHERKRMLRVLNGDRCRSVLTRESDRDVRDLGLKLLDRMEGRADE